MENQKSFFQRINVQNNKMNKSDFIKAYFGMWGILILLVIIVSLIAPSTVKGAAMGGSVGFFYLFQQRLRYFEMNKWIALVTFTGIGNVALFIYLALKSDTK